MIHKSWWLALASIGLAGAVQAQTCSCANGSGGTRIATVALITAKLSGNTVCVGGPPTWDAQEEHLAGGALWDFKRGVGHATDPRSQVGTWSVAGAGNNGQITHSYTGGPSYTYFVCQGSASAASVGFCPTAGPATVMATVKAGTGTGCP